MCVFEGHGGAGQDAAQGSADPATSHTGRGSSQPPGAARPVAGVEVDMSRQDTAGVSRCLRRTQQVVQSETHQGTERRGQIEDIYEVWNVDKNSCKR